jgi:hypothetical protein
VIHKNEGQDEEVKIEYDIVPSRHQSVPQDYTPS